MPRYCDTPFPSYRFVPGVHPHPTAHPQGHSYVPPETSEPYVPFVPPEEWRQSAAYLYGCDLYNHGYWWEAHEAWEGLWRVVPRGSVQARFLQSLIQVSARHLKLFMARLDGVTSLGRSSEGHMRFVAASIGKGVYMGLAFAAWCKAVNAYYRAAMKQPLPTHMAQDYPYIRLES